MSTGWVCPKCGRVWGPFMMACDPCNNPERHTQTTTNVVINTGGLCPSCGQDRSLPAQTGCRPGAHYGTFCVMGIQ